MGDRPQHPKTRPRKGAAGGLISLAGPALCGLALAGPVQAHPVASVKYTASGALHRAVAEGGATRDSRFAIASVGKTFTAVAVLQLVRNGDLRLDDLASKWLSLEIVHGLGGLEDVQIRHLLRMSSGLPDYYDDDYLDGVLDKPSHVRNAMAAIRTAFGHPVLFPPGERFDYSNTNYLLLGLILERVTGRPYAQILDRHVFEPAGMTDSFVFGGRDLSETFVTGHEDGEHVRDYYLGPGFGDGGAISTAPDLVRFYKALFIDGTLLDPPMVEEMLRDPLGSGYGMGIEIEGAIVGHSGGDLGFSSDIRMNLASGEIAAILMGDGDADTDWPRAVLARDDGMRDH